MTQTLLKIVANFETTLASSISSSDTAATLVSALTKDGSTIPSGTYGFTIDEGTADEEHIVASVSGTALSSMLRGVSVEDGVTEVTALKKAHRRGAKIKITNHPALIRVIRLLDGTTDLDSGTPLKYDGSPSITDANEMATKGYVDSVAMGDTNYDQEIVAGDLGETIAQGEYVYLKNDGKWWKTNASSAATSQNVAVGIAQAGGVADESVGILRGGVDKTQTYTAGQKYYLSDTAGDVATTPGTVEVFVGEGDVNGNLVFQHVSNIETLTADEKDALGGTSGTPSSTNKFATENDTTNGASITGTGIAFVNSNSTITDSGNGFVTAGFRVGQTIVVSGTSNNDGSYTLTAVAAGVLTVSESLTDESAGSSFSIEAEKTNKLVRLGSDDKLPAFDGSNLTSVGIKKSYTAGEDFAAGEPLFLKDSDGKVYPADANATDDEEYLNFIGIAAEAGVTDAAVLVALPGSIVSGLSFGDPTTTVSETTDVNQNSGGADINIGSSGGTFDIRQTFITGDVSELTEVNVYLRKVGTPGFSLTVALYEVSIDGDETGSALASRVFTESDLTTGYVEYDILEGTPVTVKPRRKYVIQASVGSADASNYYRWEYRDVASTYDDGELYRGTAYQIDGKAARFNTKYTEQRNYYLGDNVYLSDTDGSLSVEPGTFNKKIGRVLDATSMIVEPTHMEQLIYQVGWNNDSDGEITSENINFPVPRNTRFVVLHVIADSVDEASMWLWYPLGQGASTTQHGLGAPRITDMHRSSSEYGAKISGTTSLTVTPQGGGFERVQLYYFR